MNVWINICGKYVQIYSSHTDTGWPSCERVLYICSPSPPSLSRVGRPWLSSATQCYLPIILGMDTDNLCELYQRARTHSREFDATHKDIQGTDLLLPGPWLSPHLISLLCTSCNSVDCQAKVVHYERSGQCSKATRLRQQTLQDFCFGSPLRACPTLQ